MRLRAMAFFCVVLQCLSIQIAGATSVARVLGPTLKYQTIGSDYVVVGTIEASEKAEHSEAFIVTVERVLKGPQTLSRIIYCQPNDAAYSYRFEEPKQRWLFALKTKKPNFLYHRLRLGYRYPKVPFTAIMDFGAARVRLTQNKGADVVPRNQRSIRELLEGLEEVSLASREFIPVSVVLEKLQSYIAESDRALQEYILDGYALLSGAPMPRKANAKEVQRKAIQYLDVLDAKKCKKLYQRMLRLFLCASRLVESTNSGGFYVQRVMASSCFECGDYEDAAIWYEKYLEALIADKESPFRLDLEVYPRLFLTHLFSGGLREAEEILGSWLAYSKVPHPDCGRFIGGGVFPALAYPYFAQAQLYEAKAEYSKALDCYKKCVSTFLSSKQSSNRMVVAAVKAVGLSGKSEHDANSYVFPVLEHYLNGARFNGLSSHHFVGKIEEIVDLCEWLHEVEAGEMVLRHAIAFAAVEKPGDRIEQADLLDLYADYVIRHKLSGQQTSWFGLEGNRYVSASFARMKARHLRCGR